MLTDVYTGEIFKTWFFVMTLCWSRHQYAEFVRDQTVATWLGCHRRAFEAFCGVPARIIIDYVAGHIIRLMLPPRLCGRRQRTPKAALGGSRTRGNIIGYRVFNQSRSALSSFQTALLRLPAEVAQAGSHARNAAALARSVNSA